MPELHQLVQVVGEIHCDFREGIDEKRTSRFYQPKPFADPFEAPFIVVFLPNAVVESVVIIFPDIEWRVGKYTIKYFRSK